MSHSGIKDIPGVLGATAAVLLLAAMVSSCSIMRGRRDKASSEEVQMTSGQKRDKGKDKEKERNDEKSEMVDSLLDYAKGYLGKPYKYGGTSPSGFDCSGFVVFVYRHFGFDIPRTSSQQYGFCDRIEEKDLRPGDLVFFNGSRIGGSVGHVGIITEVDKGSPGHFQMIHVASSRGVTLDRFPDRYYYYKRLVGYGRVPYKEFRR